MLGVPDLGLSEELQRVEDCIRESIRSEEGLLTEIAAYVIDSGGKRLRPTMTLLSFRAVGGTKIEAAIDLAASFELIHSATLIHDDINDGGTTRRGRVAAYKRYGILNALVTGDFLFTKAFGLGGRYGEEVVAITTEACSRLAEGEIRQKRNLGNVGMRPEEYLEIVAHKTANPISAGAKIGALVGGGTPQQADALASCGMDLGIGFQIMDDILDVTGSPEVLGKRTGSDLIEGNVTLLTIRALNDAPPDDRVELARIVQSTHKSPEDVETALRIIVDSGAVEAAKREARRYADMALATMESQPDLLFGDKFRNLIDFVLSRDH
jgi:octaprenyl-diphosphate synthase